ncbi:ABC transporter substrate-binding protein [Sinorhizobium medicae]|uniref:ABC transporter substrate-binding protein n=1 Tax=Sinorhizobium medicae TaxID=110321 RepID=A0ABX4TGU4_9HYPH|nr:iron-siderophore ABC transporter substrate-binding protein [Sinorhizobium medicae]PLT85584.1 ABC transporter substrate-binding protein [Sinorhizobium medicae]PLT99349.1 ABC transporter substrate-binding protein [Sinorhizobium medicae]PLU22124.1 ABC transporter substrate-binding protein [Sinorhizobium medicae]PLU24671.1 ABC transporter substrate-binding protein [Sinorhizobium medicae]PLU28042.1 ABC transporter substrate-binding protein [Sinorhizobium medicae]
MNENLIFGFFMRFVVLALLGIMLSSPVFAQCDGRLIAEGAFLHPPLCAPKEPKRIISLVPTFSLGIALELGLPVVGAPLFGMSDEDLKSKAEAAGVVDLGSFLEPSIEKIVALQPDLIIGSSFLGEEAYQMASRLAPTALLTGANWKEFYRTLANIAGVDDGIKGRFAEYEKRVAAVRERVPKDLRVSVVRITPWEFQVFLDEPNAWAPFDVLRKAGVRRTDFETSETNVGTKRIDFEGLAGLDGDILLYIVGGSNDSATSGRHEAVLTNPLWKMLPAVKAGRVYRVDAGTWIEFNGLASANKILDDIETYIIPRP